MKPVNINAFDSIGDMQAASLIAFGAAVIRAAANTIKATLLTTQTNILGIADWDMVEKTEPGFYSQYDPVPVITAGRCRAWVIANGADVNIDAGDYLEIADLGSSNANPCGVLEEAGSAAGGTRTATSIARALEDITLGSATYKIPDADVAVGATEITMAAADLTALDLAEGDYILLEDLNGNVQVNRVKSLTSTKIGLQLPTTVALVKADSDLVHKIKQAGVMLI